MIKQHWRQHLESAILGTSRAAWSPVALPGPVHEKLDSTAQNDAATFLDATTLLYAFTKAGARSTEQTETPLPEAPEDSLPFCNTAAVDIWRRIRDLESNNPVFERRWLERCHQSGHVLAPELLAEVFTLAAHKKMAALRPLVASVAGARGRWLAGFFPEWLYVDMGDAARIWAEGKPAERLEVFRNVRKNNPSAGLQLLESTWEKESAADRRRFLEMMAAQISATDQDFLQRIREEYATVAGGGKSVVTDIKRWITRLLLLAPESPLRTEWATALRRYFNFPLIGKPTCTLPRTEDDFFNEKNLSVYGGFPKNGTDALAVATWFNELVSWIPPAVWVLASGKTPEKTLEIWSGDAEIRTRLIQASIDNSDATFAEQLLAFCSGEQWHILLGVLPEGRRETLIMGNPDYAERLNWGAPALHFHWSEAFSKWVLTLLYDSWIGYYFHRIQMIMPLDVYLNPRVRPADIPGLYDPGAKRERWLSVIVPEIRKTLEVKALFY